MIDKLIARRQRVVQKLPPIEEVLRGSILAAVQRLRHAELSL